ncbi:MAG: hypothetical protein V4508_19055 [Pseudomonadota bacterium]
MTLFKLDYSSPASSTGWVKLLFINGLWLQYRHNNKGRRQNEKPIRIVLRRSRARDLLHSQHPLAHEQRDVTPQRIDHFPYMTLFCQACERRPSLIEAREDDPNEPYLVCHECHARLMSRSLRPLEWFNLAKRHGWAKYLLHDDFYDDSGEATQPEEDVESAELFPGPTLIQSEGAAPTLLDYSVTRWNLDEDVFAAWLRLPPASVLSCTAERYADTRNPSVRAVILEVAALFREEGRAFVRRVWESYQDCGSFWALAAATAACLPEEEGFPLVTGALAAMPEKERRQLFGALAHFRSTRSLDWIECHVSAPTVDAWGYLAAASNFSWPKVDEWMKAGRPLCLIAVDALLAIANPRTLFLKRTRPVLVNPPAEQDLRNAIEGLIRTDPSVRVMQRGGALLEYVPALIGGRHSQSDGKEY